MNATKNTDDEQDGKGEGSKSPAPKLIRPDDPILGPWHGGIVDDNDEERDENDERASMRP